MVDKELIENWRNMVKLPISSLLFKTNYEGMGEQDKEEFERDFDEILDLALIGLNTSGESKWIPCSEKLPDHPENNDYYLVTIQCEHYDGWDDYVTGFAEWTKHGWDELSCYIGQIKVIAWMPMPEPYKEGGVDG